MWQFVLGGIIHLCDEVQAKSAVFRLRYIRKNFVVILILIGGRDT